MTCLVESTCFTFCVTQVSGRENIHLFSVLYLSRQNPCLVTRAVYIDILFLLTCCLDKPTKGNQPGMIHSYIIFWNDYRSLKYRWGFEWLYHTPPATFYYGSLTEASQGNLSLLSFPFIFYLVILGRVWTLLRYAPCF